MKSPLLPSCGVIEACNPLAGLFWSYLSNTPHLKQSLHAGEEAPLVVHRKMAQVSYVADGFGLALLNDEVHPLERGCIVLLAANTPHSFLSHRGVLELHHFHSPPEHLSDDRLVIGDAGELFRLAQARAARHAHAGRPNGRTNEPL